MAAPRPPEELLRVALSLLREPSVRAFVLAPDALEDARILTNEGRRASSFPYALHRVVWGDARFESEARSVWLCTPAFSVGPITVGVVVQRLHFAAADAAVRAGRPSGYSVLRFAADALSGRFLTVSAESAHGTIDMQYAAFRSYGARVSLNVVAHAAPLREAVAAGLDPALLRQALAFSFGYREDRPCVTCAERGSAACKCAPAFPAPRHPHDFSSFPACMARALGNYAGAGAQQIVIHRGEQPISAKGLFVRLAVRYLNSAGDVNELEEWAVKTRFAQLPICLKRVQIPPPAVRAPVKTSIVDELRALREEQPKSCSAASAGSIGVDEIAATSVVSSRNTYPPIPLDNLVPERRPVGYRMRVKPPVVFSSDSLDQGLSPQRSVPRVFQTPALADAALVEAVTPPVLFASMHPQRGRRRPVLSSVQEQFQTVLSNPTTTNIAETERPALNTNPNAVPAPVVTLGAHAVSLSQSFVPAHEVRPSQPLAQSSPPAVKSCSVYNKPAAVQSAYVDFQNSASPLSAGVAAGDAAPHVSATDSSQNPAAPEKVLGRLPCEFVSDASSSTGHEASVGLGRTSYPHKPIEAVSAVPAMMVRVTPSAVAKPCRRRIAARIEVNPLAPPVKATTYVGERDRKLVERKERNRKSAARSNFRRKQLRLNLERNLNEANEKLGELKERYAALQAENDVLKKSLYGPHPAARNLCQGAL